MDYMLIDLIKLLRPQQWYKNLVVFIGIIFSGNLFSAEMLWRVVAAFFLISLMSGVNYIINDIKDSEKDRLHPTKKNRPLPAGKISKTAAGIFSAAIFLAVSYFSFMLSENLFYILILFFLLGLAYTFYLKNIFLVDIIAISINFVLRAIMGVAVINASNSTWLIIMAFLFALVLATTKRKGEIYLLGRLATAHRKNLMEYDSEFLNYISIFSLTSLFLSYAVYAVIVKAGTYFSITLPIVVYIIFRYLHMMIKSPEELAHPEKFLFNPSIIFAGCLLAVLVFSIFYLPIPQLIKT